ncbi:MAG TPA: Arm DNA-binding domain-containing protein [Puia sp.]|nr:Arm DNA-binding domain-containing protein [Puia sp.]
MSLLIKPICLVNKIKKDGTSVIFFQYCYNTTKRILLNTGISIPINIWNKKSRRVSEKLPAEFGDYEILNDELNRQKRILEDLFTPAVEKEITNKGAFVKQTFLLT